MIVFMTACAFLGVVRSDCCLAETLAQGERFRQSILTILEDRCYDCHGDGANKGSLALDQFESDADLMGQVELWWKVAKNIRARLMPPSRKPQLTADEREKINQWIQSVVFGIDPSNPDPGRVTLRRLNRIEYRNTIRDLIGIDFNAEVEFPPDDTGYGFDNIGDVLSVSPLLLEKYVKAAETLVDRAVPKTSKVIPEITVPGKDFRSEDGKHSGDQISFYDAAVLTQSIDLQHSGDYRVVFEVHVRGQFAFDPGRCRAIFSVDSEALAQDEFVYAFSDDPDRGASFRYEIARSLASGRHELTIELQPLVKEEERLNRLDFSVKSVTLQGPMESRHWVQPKTYADFFSEGAAPGDLNPRREYARRLLNHFGRRAFRRPVNERVLDALVSLAESTYSQPNKTFEEGIARSMAAILASPRFLFRIESADASDVGDAHPSIDEWALASRLSYFFWSSMPDKTLFELAEQGKLREQLNAQIVRMIQSEKSEALVQNFTGQWLQARNIGLIQVEPAAALGLAREREQLREEFGRELRRGGDGGVSPKLAAARKRYREISDVTRRFSRDVRPVMRKETEMFFDYVMRENRSVLEFLDSDYAFLNEALAEHYGIPGVTGSEMRRVELPKDSPRGGVLTQGNMLFITSNPTRTSPVKRGLFILENILGSPTPPAPPNVPELEEAAERFGDHEPSLREILARHREDALCSSCHSRIDPLGLAFEHFTALGSWRDREDQHPIDASGKLITGESFDGVQELKNILMNEYRLNFYRCLTEKLLIYALGRGLEYYDDYTVDRIVERLDRDNGAFMSLITGIVESSPFQRRRTSETLNTETETTADLLIVQKDREAGR